MFSVYKCELYHEVSYMSRFAVGQNVTLFVNFLWDQYFKQDSDERRVMNEEIEKLKTEKNVLMVCIMTYINVYFCFPKFSVHRFWCKLLSRTTWYQIFLTPVEWCLSFIVSGERPLHFQCTEAL